ncbi:glycosyltransferase [Exiguobacterium sp. TDN 0502]
MGKDSDEPNGVNIKNRHFKKYFTEKEEIILIDTNDWKKKKVKLLMQIIFFSIISKKIIISINSISAYQIIKVLTSLKLKLEGKIVYLVVGGSFSDKIKDNEFEIKYFKNLKQVFVQTNKMELDLKNMGLNNVSHLPNSKFFEKPVFNSKTSNNGVLKCVYLGRIHPDKGINFIFDNLSSLNKSELKYSIEFFGPIESEYKDEFINNINIHSFSEYSGILDFSKKSLESYEKLSQYDIFLFPTFWGGEGFPGVIIDSFISGVPVLASDWNHNREVINSGENGLIFETKNDLEFKEKLDLLRNNIDFLQELKKGAYKSSDKYHSRNVLKKIDSFL